MAVAEPAGDGDTVTALHEYRDKLHWSGRIPPSSSRCVLVGIKGELQGLASTRANEHTSTKLQKIFNYVHCSATPQREAAPATKATRGQSQVPDRGSDSRSAGFPPPLPP